jgi:polyisoprenoid-binding protein YceI
MKALLTVLVFCGAQVFAGERLIIAPAPANEVALEVEKTGFYSGKKHHLVFTRYRGTLDYDQASPERSTVEITVEAGSVEAHDTWIDAKDREKVRVYAIGEELETDRYPEITFRSNSISRIGEGKYAASGPLTIHGVTKEVTVNVAMNRNPDGMTLTGDAPLKLSDFKLKRPSAAFGTIGTKDDITVRFHLTSIH